MATTMEVLNHRLTALASILVLGGMGLAFMDTRHASASDMAALTQEIQSDRIDAIEYQIAETERRIKRILLIPAPERSQWDAVTLTEEMDRKEYLLRKLQAIMERANAANK